MYVSPETTEIIRRLDALVRLAHESLRDWYFRLLEISTALVLLGVILEGPEVISESLELFRKWGWLRTHKATHSEWWPLPPEHTGNWITVCSLVGLTLVCVGVTGEGIFEALVTISDGKLQTFNNMTISDAATRASSAEAMARGFQSQIAKAEAEAAASKALAEGEKLERRKLEARLGPRSLDFDTQQMITDVLRKFSGHPQISVTSYGEDAEAWALGAQLIEIISAATGVQPLDRRANLSVTGGFETGITIRGPISESVFMEAMRAALTDIGKLREVAVNGPILVPAVTTGGPVVRGGPTAQGGQARVLPAAPSTGPVAIMVAVKPVPVSLQKLK